MRLLHTFKSDRDAKIFSRFLSQEEIENTLEISPVTDWGSEDYGTLSCLIWIVDEEDRESAQQWLALFLANPKDPRFTIHTQPPSIPPIPKTGQSDRKDPKLRFLQAKNALKQSAFDRKKPIGVFTLYLILFCTIVFFATQATKRPFEAPPANIPLTPLFSSPIKKELLYDYPSTYQMVDKLVKAYGFENLFNPRKLPPDGQFLLKKMHATANWQGLYQKVVDYLKPSGKPITIQAPLFEKIRDGEVWRLITPIFIHADLFHLFFNMIWLLVLGTQMERRLGVGKMILFISISAAFSNTAQYLMSGPDFIGFSGVLCAMIVFVWLRQKSAPWEGYQLHSSTMIFISIFVSAMALIQCISFALEVMGYPSIAPPIANTAHLSGALSGFFMAKIPFFKWKLKK